MTVVQPTGARSTPEGTWHTINWYAVHRTVRRLQARIVKAVQAGRACRRLALGQGASLATSPDPLVQRQGACC